MARKDMMKDMSNMDICNEYFGRVRKCFGNCDDIFGNIFDEDPTRYCFGRVHSQLLGGNEQEYGFSTVKSENIMGIYGNIRVSGNERVESGNETGYLGTLYMPVCRVYIEKVRVHLGYFGARNSFILRFMYECRNTENMAKMECLINPILLCMNHECI